jgi:hypothetical protein
MWFALNDLCRDRVPNDRVSEGGAKNYRQMRHRQATPVVMAESEVRRKG